MTTNQTHTLVLPDRRRLGYAELGDVHGHPVFFFHGSPGSRFVLSSEDALVQLPGFRFILPERPGYGLSDPKPERTLLDWPNDVKALADHLELDTFAVMGESGGGPHALACGYSLPERVHTVCLLASPAPAGFKGAQKGLSLGNRMGLLIGRFFPGVVKWSIRLSAQSIQKEPERYLDAISAQMALPDQQLLKNTEFRAAVLKDVKEAYSQGGEGHATDGPLVLTSSSWGFALSDVKTPVYLWHGILDTLATRAMAEHLEKNIPNCTARYIENAGHLLTEYPEVIEEIGEVLRSAVSN